MLDELSFSTAVTFVVGENGSGKSALIEGLAYGMQAYAIGAFGSVARDPLLQHGKVFSEAFFFVRRQRAKVRMFLRAEDVYGYVRAQLEEAAVLEREAEEIASTEGQNQMSARLLQDMAQSIHAQDPDGRSHGESFLNIMEGRLHGGGLYFLDEPEAPLSPERQLALLDIINKSIGYGGQFIIATHSPVLLALPGATIYQIGDSDIARVEYDEVKNVAFMKDFLNNQSKYI